MDGVNQSLDRGDGVLPPRHRCEGGGRNKTDTQAKRRNGCNGPGALELRWALGARGALAPPGKGGLSGGARRRIV